MKKDERNMAARMNFLAAGLFYVAAIVGFVTGGSYGILFLCLGSMCLCAGAAAVQQGRRGKPRKRKKK